MKLTRLALLVITLLSSAYVSHTAQSLEKIPEVDFTRETELDAKGLQQFKAFEGDCPDCAGRGSAVCRGCDGLLPRCSECGGEKLAPCRTCAGTGSRLDPLVELVCPYCKGSGWYDCAICDGAGDIIVTSDNGDSVEEACLACKKVGRFECVVCDQQRKLPSIRIQRKSPVDAKLEKLVSTREKLVAFLPDLEAFEPLPRANKSAKAFEVLIKKGKKPGRLLPPLKDMLDLLEVVQKGLRGAGDSYTDFEGRQAHQYRVFRDRSIYLLRHSIRVLDLCIARAEFNAKVSKAGK